MKKNNSRAANRIVISGLVFLLLASMLWEIVSAYYRGGSEAPSIPLLIAGIVVLGGGMVFAAVILYRGIVEYFHSSEKPNTDGEDNSKPA